MPDIIDRLDAVAGNAPYVYDSENPPCADVSVPDEYPKNGSGAFGPLTVKVPDVI